jgi:hypothetical protein
MVVGVTQAAMIKEQIEQDCLEISNVLKATLPCRVAWQWRLRRTIAPDCIQPGLPCAASRGPSSRARKPQVSVSGTQVNAAGSFQVPEGVREWVRPSSPCPPAYPLGSSFLETLPSPALPCSRSVVPLAPLSTASLRVPLRTASYRFVPLESRKRSGEPMKRAAARASADAGFALASLLSSARQRRRHFRSECSPGACAPLKHAAAASAPARLAGGPWQVRRDLVVCPPLRLHQRHRSAPRRRAPQRARGTPPGPAGRPAAMRRWTRACRCAPRRGGREGTRSTVRLRRGAPRRRTQLLQ